MNFKVQDSGDIVVREGKQGELYRDKLVMYDEDYDWLDPDDPDYDEYTLPFTCHTVLTMLRNLPEGVRWNPRTEEFEGW